jgi:septum formation protein
VVGTERLGKPHDDDEAAAMLAALSGGVHEVITGIALVAPPNRRIIAAERTRVFFRDITPGEISAYIETGEPVDKAGAYAIQGHAAVFVEKIEGCFFNVVGMPVFRLFSMLRALGSQR